MNVQGDLTVEVGAKLTGGVRADKVTIAGELEGNVEQATLVELQQTGMVVGDVKAGSLTVAAGALCGPGRVRLEEGKGAKGGKHGTSRSWRAARPHEQRAPGRARGHPECPHCRETVLESAAVCPACRHYLRYAGVPKRPEPALAPLRIEGSIRHPQRGTLGIHRRRRDPQ